MTRIFKAKNLYDVQGRFIIGVSRDDHTLLQEKNIYADLTSHARKILNKFFLNDRLILDSSIQILDMIINKAESESWKILLDTLGSHFDWIYEHSINVSIISLMIGINNGYGLSDLMDLGTGSLLHDVGKLTMPMSIIEKPASLSRTEMFFVKQHCELSASIVKKYNLPKTCLNMIVQHHERLDGSGYPYALKDDEISEYAKIIMVADVVDAITSSRPYRKAQKFSVAMDELIYNKDKFSKRFVYHLQKIIDG